MLLQKCCHDLDLILYFMRKHCRSVQSFGALSYFRPENQPKGAADRCTDCPVEIESTCPASAIKIYLRDRVNHGNTGWPVNLLTPNPTPETVAKALREGPYGRCAFKCDNDVVDHQVVNLIFEDDSTAQMTMTAFAEGPRRTRIFGTKGELEGDSTIIKVNNFLTGDVRTIDTNVVDDGNITTGHGGGDGRLMEAFLRALETGDRSYILSGIDETLESHTMVFQAEASRLSGQVCDI